MYSLLLENAKVSVIICSLGEGRGVRGSEEFGYPFIRIFMCSQPKRTIPFTLPFTCLSLIFLSSMNYFVESQIFNSQVLHNFT